jgi:16S rRNA C967 or C1407 C5-methylase (RsmB/RsmF family)/NOL1/NOP2/fmu family ribosome biogenesis protein
MALTPSLPAAFVARMADLLGPEVDDFLAALAGPRVRGLRVNRSKVDPSELERLLGVDLTPVPWCPSGYTFDSPVSLGSHPAHAAGLFYLQEPSAMAPVELLPVGATGWVADLAAAPGGKTLQLADRAGAMAVLANEVEHRRLGALHDNLDRWGCRNVVTSARTVDQLVAAGVAVDGAVLDAPCSGEGLFRRQPGAVREWSVDAVQGSARRQARLLDAASALVRPGGHLAYSTCTFAREENEDRVAAFLAAHPDWAVAPAPSWPGVPPGPTLRFWPHRIAGEGQFVAAFGRTDDGDQPAAPAGHRPMPDRRPGRPRTEPARPRPHRQPVGREPGPSGSDAEVRDAWTAFQRDVVPDITADETRLIVRGANLYLAPAAELPLPADDLARPGLPLGQLRPGRFQPHPALSAAVGVGEDARRLVLPAGSSELAHYLAGETVESAGPDGWVLVCYQRWGLGWGRRSQGIVKNRFPRHLRTTG